MSAVLRVEAAAFVRNCKLVIGQVEVSLEQMVLVALVKGEQGWVPAGQPRLAL